ncbi:hypothetical protein [Paucimonas lemoignei]|uniref:hypothetical protein n=1 Tax=Paucimonas lemoignei TaxID=29443 RepID=UPI001404B88C|nr:hypothetical protein [Paucimonas lemoignei]
MNLSDAAKLVRKARTTLLRDIENGRLTRTVLQDGDVRIDTAELLRFYGRLHSPAAAPKPREPRKDPADKNKIALLEERIRSLERVIALEAELRRVKDQVTSELRLRLADKDHMIKILESKILFLEYDKQALQSRAVPTLEPEQAVRPPARQPGTSAASAAKPAAVPPAAPAAPTATAPTAATASTTSTTPQSTSASPHPDHSGHAAASAPQTVTTQPAATTIHTYPTAARGATGAPGGVERRHTAKPGGWWRRLFGGKPDNF